MKKGSRDNERIPPAAAIDGNPVPAGTAAEAEWQEIQKIISQYYGEWTDTTYPGSVNNRIPNTALMGNGDVGISSGGDDSHKSFSISKGDFWEYNSSPLKAGTISVGLCAAADKSNLIPQNYNKITVSSLDASCSDPAMAVNGQWRADGTYQGWVSLPDQSGYWMAADFKEAITFNRWVVRNDNAARPGNQAFNTGACEIQISTDGLDWTTVSSVSGNSADVINVYTDEAYTTKYVRLLITEPVQNTADAVRQSPRARIGAFELYYAETEYNVNLALTSKGVAAVSSPTSYAEFAADHAINGSCPLDTFDGWTTNIGKTQWLMLDMGRRVAFNRWIVRNDGFSRADMTARNTKACRLQHWTGTGIPAGGETEGWTDLDAVTDNTANVIDRNLPEECKAQFIRLYITEPNQASNEDLIKHPRATVIAFELYNMQENTTEISSAVMSGTDSACCTPEPEKDTVAFHEKMDILNAKVVTVQQFADVPLQIESWMSATNNLFIMEITSLSEKTDAEIRVNLQGAVNGGRPVDAAISNGCMLMTRSTLPAVRTDLDPIYETVPYISKVALAAKVIGAQGFYYAETNTSANLLMTLPAGKTVYVVTAVCGGGRTYTADGKLWEGRTEPAAEAEALLAAIGTETDVITLRDAHRNWWKRYWMQSYISMDTSDPDLDAVQKYYYAAQYELGAGIRCGKMAAGLYGIWHSNDSPSWHSDFHLNYNFIAAYYGLAASNRVSMLLPAVEAIMDYVPQGIKNAGSIQQLRVIDSRNLHIDRLIELGQVDPEKGIENAVLYPVAIAPYGMTVENNAYHGETLDAPFSVYPLVEYYNFTQDKEFMKDTLYVYIRYVLNFLEHWLVKEDGRYVHYAAYNEGSWAKNASLELMAYKMCLKYGIRIAQEIGDDDNAAKWQEISDNLAPQALLGNYNGTGKTILGLADTYLSAGSTEWIVPADVPGLSGGNTLPLEAIVPFEVFGYYSSAEELEIIRNTVDAYNGSWAQINSFPKIYVQAVNTRYDCRSIVRNFAGTIRLQMKKNMMIEDYIHGIEKAGATEAVNNMMLLSDKGIIKLFGNWLEDKDASFTRLRAAGAFVFSAKYDSSAREIAEGAVMYSEAGETATVASLWKHGMTVLDENGNPVKTVKSTAPNHEDEIVYTFATEKGRIYTFVK